MATAAEKKAAAAEAKAKEEAEAAKAAKVEVVSFDEVVEVEDPPDPEEEIIETGIEFEATPKSENNEAGVVLIYRRTKTIPGTKKKLFGLDCVANEDGLFETTVSPERAEIEVKRTVLARFEKK